MDDETICHANPKGGIMRKTGEDWNYQALMIITCNQLVAMREQLDEMIMYLMEYAPGFKKHIKKAEKQFKELNETIRDFTKKMKKGE